MSPEKDAYLCEKYPKIFVNRNSDVKESCMAWGFEINDGWFHIINNACSLIQSHIDWNLKQRDTNIKFNTALEHATATGDRYQLYEFYCKDSEVDDWTKERVERDIESGKHRLVVDESSQVTADQIKEKFGTLRFYYSGGDDYVDGVVRMAEAMSGCTCEVCGKPGSTGGKGWIRTTCEEHTK